MKRTVKEIFENYSLLDTKPLKTTRRNGEIIIISGKWNNGESYSFELKKSYYNKLASKYQVKL